MSSADCAPDLASEKRSSQLLAITFPLLALASIVVGLRIWSRRLQQSRLWYDDWLILTALILCAAFDFTVIPLYRNGLGRHETCVGSEAVVFFLKVMFAWDFLYTIIIAIVKYSILLYLYRLFSVGSFKWSFWILWVLVSAWALAVIVTSLVLCDPVDAFWMPERGSCMRTQQFFIASAVPNIVTDVLLLCLPIPWVLQLRLRSTIKASLIAVFGCGALVIVISSFRLHALLRTTDGSDRTMNDMTEVLWTLAEVNIAIVSACLPSLSALFKRLVLHVKREDPDVGRMPALPPRLTLESETVSVASTLYHDRGSANRGPDTITLHKQVSVHEDDRDIESGQKTYTCIIESNGGK